MMYDGGGTGSGGHGVFDAQRVHRDAYVLGGKHAGYNNNNHNTTYKYDPTTSTVFSPQMLIPGYYSRRLDLLSPEGVEQEQSAPLGDILYMYTTYHAIMVIVLLMYPSALPGWCENYVKAMAVTTAVGWAFLYVFLGPRRITFMYRSRLPRGTWKYERVLLVTLTILDVCVHVLPFFLLGTPANRGSYLWVGAVLIAYYFMIRPSASRIYNVVSAKKLDLIAFVCVPFIVAALYSWGHDA